MTNVTDTTYSISVDNAYNNDLLWINWTASDALRAYINGYDSIERNYQIGRSNVSIPPFSINTCMTVIRGDMNQDNLLNVADIVMLINFILNTDLASDKQEVISDMNSDGIMNVIDIIAIVNIIVGTRE